MTKVSIHFSNDERQAVEAAAAGNETTYSYVKRVTLAHAHGDWKVSGVADLRDAIQQIKDLISTASAPAMATVAHADPDLASQVKQLTQAMNLVAKVVLQIQTEHKQLTKSNQALTKSISEALL